MGPRKPARGVFRLVVVVVVVVGGGGESITCLRIIRSGWKCYLSINSSLYTIYQHSLYLYEQTIMLVGFPVPKPSLVKNVFVDFNN